jgi:glycosyltransferase involved in cell wall biosynthesis
MLHLAPDARVALMFGFIRPYKGLDVFLEAVRLAAGRDPAVVGMVAGRPLYDISASRRTATLRRCPVRWDLRFIPREDLATFFAAADVVILPYIDTSDSGCLELAAAFAKPVVVTSTGGMEEAFQRYGNGRVVPPGDAAALAEAMLATYPDRPDASPALNSWEHVASRSEALYVDLLGRTDR